jgi:single-stranded-DNA-specific exonuclease
VSYYIPHRLKEGYGLQVRHVSEVAVPRRAALLITVDCGSGSYAAVEAARAAGVDVIITDHHTLGDRLPNALAVINPKRKDCTAGLDRLAGVGVKRSAWRSRTAKSTCAISILKGRAEPTLEVSVRLGPAPLRTWCLCWRKTVFWAKTGLELIGLGRRPGLVALMERRGHNRPADSKTWHFAGPQLNAAGRVDHAALAVDLRPPTARTPPVRIAQTLNTLNANRQDIERGILQTSRPHRPTAGNCSSAELVWRIRVGMRA